MWDNNLEESCLKDRGGKTDGERNEGLHQKSLNYSNIFFTFFLSGPGIYV